METTPGGERPGGKQGRLSSEMISLSFFLKTNTHRGTHNDTRTDWQRQSKTDSIRVEKAKTHLNRSMARKYEK